MLRQHFSHAPNFLRRLYRTCSGVSSVAGDAWLNEIFLIDKYEFEVDAKKISLCHWIVFSGFFVLNFNNKIMRCS
ncbi:hypothetical protein D3C80_2093070 [compost metagenome]